MIEPVEANDDLTSCAFSGCPALRAGADGQRTRLEVAADVVLDGCRLASRPIEWMILGAVLYVALAG